MVLWQTAGVCLHMCARAPNNPISPAACDEGRGFCAVEGSVSERSGGW